MPWLLLAHHGNFLAQSLHWLAGCVAGNPVTEEPQDQEEVCAAAQKGATDWAAVLMQWISHCTLQMCWGCTRVRVAPGASSSIGGLRHSAVQVLALVVATIVARTHAEQEMDEADLSLAYSGGSGRVSPFSTFWLSASCIRHVRSGEHASNSDRRNQQFQASWSLHPSFGRTLRWSREVFSTCPETEAWPAVLVEVAAVGPRGLRICTQRAHLAVNVHEIAHGSHREHSQHGDAPRGLPAFCFSSHLPRIGVQALHDSLWEGCLTCIVSAHQDGWNRHGLS